MPDTKRKDNPYPMRIPEPLKSRLVKFAKKAGQSKAAVIRTALDEYLTSWHY